MADSSVSDYRPFLSPCPESSVEPPGEAELLEGATQPPTDRPPPPPEPPDLIPETNDSSAATSRSHHQQSDPDGSNNDEDESRRLFLENHELNFFDEDDSGSVNAVEIRESLWLKCQTHQQNTRNSKKLTIQREEYFHQQVVLHGIRVYNIKIHVSKASLNDGHPISRAVLLRHAKLCITESLPCGIRRHEQEGIGIYYRGDFVASGRECAKNESGHWQMKPVVASKNTTPFKILLPPKVDEAISDLELAWEHEYGDSNIICYRQWSEGKQTVVVSEVNVTAPLFLAVLYRSSLVSIRYDHYTKLQHLDESVSCPKPECTANSKYVLRAMACLSWLHQETCTTLDRVKKDRNLYETTMNHMHTDMSKYLVYYCDEKGDLPYKHIELPHFVTIELHRGEEVISLAMFYQQVPPYYFGIPVSLCSEDVATPSEYQHLISTSREYNDINKYFHVVIDKVNHNLAGERESFFNYRPDLREHEHRLLQIYPYRFDQDLNPDCKCRHLKITIHDNVA